MLAEQRISINSCSLELHLSDLHVPELTKVTFKISGIRIICTATLSKILPNYYEN